MDEMFKQWMRQQKPKIVLASLLIILGICCFSFGMYTTCVTRGGGILMEDFSCGYAPGVCREVCKCSSLPLKRYSPGYCDCPEIDFKDGVYVDIVPNQFDLRLPP